MKIEQICKKYVNNELLFLSIELREEQFAIKFISQILLYDNDSTKGKTNFYIF